MRIALVLVNWNQPAHTLACLDSLLRLQGPQPEVIVCDNGSDHDAYRMLEAGIGACRVPPRADWRPYRLRTRMAHDGVEGSGDSHRQPTLTLLRLPRNLGFAGGVNACLRLALADPLTAFVWVLNNDTVVDPGALSALLRVMAARPEVACCGSTLLYFGQPPRIQAVGGIYDPWLGRTRHVLGNQPYSAARCAAVSDGAFDYLVGGSLFFRRSALARVGLLAEDYFLFFEELDWCTRLRREAPELALGYAPDSLVFHHEGASTGISAANGAKTYRYDMDFYFQRSRLLFARRHTPLRHGLIRLTLLGVAGNRLRRRQWRSVIMALGLLVGWLPPGWIPEPIRRPGGNLAIPEPAPDSGQA